jgi:hypothetical protein
VASLQTEYHLALKQVDHLSEKNKIVEDQLHEKTNNDESRLSEFKILLETLTDERDQAVNARLNAQQVLDKLAHSVDAAQSWIHGVLMDRFSLMDQSIDRLQNRFENAQDMALRACGMLKKQYEIKRKLLLENMEHSNNYQVIGDMESTIKSQGDTIKGFEMALIEAQKYMDEKEHLAEERLSELSKLQTMHSEVSIETVVITNRCLKVYISRT